MTSHRRSPRRRAIVTTTLAAPLIAIGSLTAVALAQPAPDEPGVTVDASAFRFAEKAARDLRRARAWSGPTDAASLARDATRRDLVVLMERVVRMPRGRLGTTWRDIAADDPRGRAARYAVARRFLTTPGGAVGLDQPLTGSDANRAWTYALRMKGAVARMARFRDGAGRRYSLPSGFATSIVAREAGLRRNYPSSDDVLERHDSQPLRLADLVLMAHRARGIRRAGVPSPVRALQRFRIPAVDPQFVPTIQRALSQVGNPYVWGGEWTDTNSPLDPQAAGGFDCSGLVWFVWHTGDRAVETSINTPSGRSTYTMNVGNRGRRIAWQRAQGGDLVFFGDRGRKTPLAQASHMSISLGNKWIIHSSGGRGGVSISWLPTYWPKGLMNARTFLVGNGVPTVPDAPESGAPPPTTPVDAEPVTPVPQPPGASAPQAPAPSPAAGGSQAPQPPA